MTTNTVTVLLFFTIDAIKATVNLHGPTVVEDFTNCMNTIVEYNFNEPKVLIYADLKNASTPVTNIRAKLLKKIHEKVKYSVEVMTPQNEVDICNNYDEKLSILHIDRFEARPLGEYFIMIVDTYKEFPYLVNRLIRSRSWNPSAKFVILLFSFAEDKTNIQNVENILSCLYKYNVINTAVIVPQANNVRNAIIYSWRPYDPPKYCGYYNETARDRVFVKNKCEKGFLKHNKRIFGDSIPSNMNGCVLYIIALERQPFVSNNTGDTSIEEILTDELVKRYHLTTNYEIINMFRGERNDQMLWDGALRELIKKKGQLLLGGIFPDFDVHEDFDSSLSYLTDSYTWVVPRAYKSPRWIALVIIFTNFVWLSMIATFSICTLFWRILGQLSGDAPFNRSLDHCFMNAWICSLGFCAYLRPTTGSLRLFFVFFNIYCILVVTNYQTKLIDVLKNPTFEYQIKTVEELVDSGLKFGGFEELHDLFYNSSDQFDNFLYEHWITVDDISSAMLDVVVHRNFSLLCSRMELAHISAVIPDLSDSFGKPKYYAFDMNMFTVPMEMVALRGFGLMSKISKTIHLFKQAGLTEKMKDYFSFYNNRRRAHLLRFLLQEKSDINSLSLQHLQGGFFALTLGYVTGVLVLALEIASNTKFIRRKFTRKNIVPSQNGYEPDIVK